MANKWCHAIYIIKLTWSEGEGTIHYWCGHPKGHPGNHKGVVKDVNNDEQGISLKVKPGEATIEW